MQINKLVFGGLILACLTAAGAGAYLATRHNVQAANVAPTPEPAAIPAPQAVTASEGVVSEPAAAPPSTSVRPAPVVAASPQAAPATPAARRVPPAPVAPRREAPVAQRQAAARPAPPVEAAPSTTPVSEPAAGGSMWESRPTVQPAMPDQPAPEPEPIAPPEAEFLELIVPADAVIGLQLESTVSSDRAKVEDAVDARVTRDVRVGGRVAIPAGSLVHGTVTEVERGGKMRERARLGIRFHTVVLAGGDRLNLRTDAITREGASPGRESAAKVGGAAVGGAILGAILGGRKGAAIGGAVGAGGGTAAVMAGEANVVTVPAGSTVSVRIQQPVTVTVEKE